MSWLQEENAQLRQAQTALLGELLSLRTELAAVSHRIGLPMAGPSAALVSVAHRAQELSSGARAASGSSGHPVKQKFEVRAMVESCGGADRWSVHCPKQHVWKQDDEAPSQCRFSGAATVTHGVQCQAMLARSSMLCKHCVTLATDAASVPPYDVGSVFRQCMINRPVRPLLQIQICCEQCTPRLCRW